MNNQNSLKFNPLAWVKHEIDQSLDRAREAMSAFVDNPKDSHHLTNALSLIRDVQGTLEVAELKGAALLAEESLAVVRELLSEGIKDPGEAARLVVHALIQLPDYLDYIGSGKDDFPLLLVAAINELRTVRQADFVSDDVASFSRLEKDDEILASQHRSGESLENVAGLTRLVFELGLLGWYRKKNVKESLRKMALVCRRLRDASGHRASRRLWWVSQALIEALYADLLRPSAAVKSLLGKVDRQIKHLFDVGEDEFSATIQVVLVKNLLSYVANARPGNRTVDAVRHAYFLDSELPTPEALAAAGVSLSGQNNALFHSVSKALLEDIADVKDRLDLDSQTEVLKTDDVALVGASLERLVETLEMLGLEGHTQNIAGLHDTFKLSIGQGGTLKKGEIDELAIALVEIERAVETFGVMGGTGGRASGDSLSATNQDYLAVRRMVITEALADLEQCKQLIQSYTVESRELCSLKEVPLVLSHIHGAMLLVSLDGVATLTEQIRGYIDLKLEQNHNIQDQELEKLAEAIAAAEVYLEMLDGTGVEQPDFLDTGRAALASIYAGTDVGLLDEPEDDAPVVIPASETDGDLDEIRAAFYREAEQPGEHSSRLDQTLSMSFLPELESPAEFGSEHAAESVEEQQDLPRMLASGSDEPVADVTESGLFESLSDDLVGLDDTYDPGSDDHTVLLPDDEAASASVVDQALATGHSTDSLFGDFERLNESAGGGEAQGRKDDEPGTAAEFTQVLPDDMGFDPLSRSLSSGVGDASDSLENFTLDLSAADIPDSGFSQAFDQEYEAFLSAPLDEDSHSTVAKSEESDLPGVPCKVSESVELLSDDEASGPNQWDLMASDSDSSQVFDLESSFIQEEINLDSVFLRSISDENETIPGVGELSDSQLVLPVEGESAFNFDETLSLDSSELSAVDGQQAGSMELEPLVGNIFDEESVDSPAVAELRAFQSVETGLSSDGEHESILSASTLQDIDGGDGSLAFAGLVDESDPLEESSDDLGVVSLDTAMLDSDEFTAASGQDDDSLDALLDEGSGNPDTGAWAITAEHLDDDQSGVADAALLTVLELPEIDTNKSESTDVLKGLVVVPDDIDEDIYQIFLEEFAEESVHLSESFPLWKDNRSNGDALLQARRSFHTLKGSGRLIGAQVVGEYAWYHEKILNQLVDGVFEPGREIDECLSAGIALLPSLKQQLESRSEPDDCVRSQAVWAESLSQGHFRHLEEANELVDEGGLDDVLLLEPTSVSDDVAVIVPEKRPIAPSEDLELQKIFIADSKYHLEMLETSLARATGDALSITIDEAMVIAVHTLNGSARTADVPAIYFPCSSSERYLRKKQSHNQKLDASDVALVGRLGKSVGSVLTALESGTQVLDTRDVTDEFDHLLVALSELPEATTHNQEFGVHEPDAPKIAALELEPEQASDVGEDVVSEVLTQPVEMDGLSSLRPEVEATEQISGLLEVFLEECGDILETCDDVMLRWKSAPTDVSPVSELQRQIHTLKGGAKMAGLVDVGDLSHALESLLTQVSAETEVTAPPIAEVHAALDMISEIAEARRSGQPVPSVTESISFINRLLIDESAEPDSDETQADQATVVSTEPETVVEPILIDSVLPVATRPTDAGQQTQLQEAVKIKSVALDGLVDNVGEVNVFHSRVEQQMSTFGFNLLELDQTIKRLTEQLRRLEMEAEAQILHRFDGENIDPDDTGISERFDPLELDRYSNLQQLSRSLAESTNDLSSLHQLLTKGLGDVEGLLMQQSRVSNELQEGLMRTRMSRFKVMVPRLRRIVRRTAQELGKNVELTFSGDDSELDRKLLESIAVPLEHMLRNAVAHGIESPEIRAEKAKPEVGAVHISIVRDGPEILIEIADDGAGIDRSRVVLQAISSGLIEAGTESQLSDQEIQSLILQPGFSTAEEVSQIAGRGVGMDVVLTQLKRVKGSLEIRSEAGVGTQFRVTLPFTLAINQALLLGAGSETYAVPMGAIDGVVQLSPTVLEALLEGDQPTIEYGGSKYHLRHLATVLERRLVKMSVTGRTLPVILARSGEHLFAFIAEQLVGNREIVVKSLSSLISRVSGVSGATILGDGRVILILDVTGLIRSQLEGRVAVTQEAAAEEVGRDKLLTVMVVDDSITIRKVTARMLERHNFEVVTAKDGLDAVSQLQNVRPDLMLLDIEMPRMDGFELAAHMRNTDENSAIPIIMISSRTGKKHRDQAAELGVNYFLGKPYQDTELLENIASVLGESAVAHGN